MSTLIGAEAFNTYHHLTFNRLAYTVIKSDPFCSNIDFDIRIVPHNNSICSKGRKSEFFATVDTCIHKRS